MKTLDEFYDRMYRNDPVDFEVVSVVEEVIKDCVVGKALDVGAGLGRHSIFLAKHGFEVDAIDISGVAVKILGEIAAKQNLKIHAYRCDLLNDEIEGQFDLVVCSCVLNHFSIDQLPIAIKVIQEHTLPGGRHALLIYNDEGTLPAMDPCKVKCYLPRGVIANFYRHWEITSYAEWTEVIRFDTWNVMTKLIVRKPAAY